MRIFSRVFFLKFCSLSSHIWVCGPFWINFCVRCIRSKDFCLFIFCMWLFGRPSVCWKDCLFPREWFWRCCQSQLTRDYFQTRVYPTGLSSCLMPAPHCLGHCSFLVSLSLLTLFFFFKIVLASCVLLWFLINFRVICSSTVKNVISILIRILLNLYTLVVWTF